MRRLPGHRRISGLCLRHRRDAGHRDPIGSLVMGVKNRDAGTLASGQDDGKGLCYYTSHLC